LTEQTDSEFRSLNRSAGFLLGVAHKRVSQLLMTRLREYDISSEQWSVLYVINQEEGIIQKEIALRSGKDKPTVTRILDALEDKGLIIRKPGSTDRRAFLIYPTPKGREIAEQTEPIETGMNRDIAECLGKEEYEDLLRRLSRIIQFADAMLDKDQEGRR
jgi:MarR family transcriptional regulator, transcriptional regulator for hemolysin